MRTLLAILLLAIVVQAQAPPGYSPVQDGDRTAIRPTSSRMDGNLS